jgi:hypothetical protein
MITEEKCETKCSRCRTYRFPSQFFNDKGRTMKTCQVCRDKEKIVREKNKCEHDKIRSRCKDCGGASICEHDRQRNQCKDCGGASICEHGKRRSLCKDCGGSYICEHGKQRNQCKDCGGSSICEHGKIRSYCKECMNDEQKIEFIKKSMISNSRSNDKKKDRYDANNFIDHCFLTGLFEDSTNCHYCSVEFTYNELCNTFVTIERLNNSIGHIKSNCVLACWHCNIRHTD